MAPAWLSPDTVVYISRAERGTGSPLVRILKQPANGARRPEIVYEDEDNVASLFVPLTVVPGSRSLLVGGLGVVEDGDYLLHTLLFRPGIDTIPVPVLANPVWAETAAIPSPDGQWLAYSSYETGGWEVFVRPFPDLEANRVPVSVGGGVSPVWSPDGTEIFYVRGDSVVLAARVETRPGIRITGQELLFPLTGDYVTDPVYPFAGVAPDGRFLMMRRLGTSELTFVVEQNFFERLERLVPN
jgi:hypothetical protein